MDFYFITIAILLLLTNLFWAYVCFNLINRLMSRNFYEYKVADSVSDKKKGKTAPQGFVPPLDQDELNHLNSLIPGL